MQLSTPITHRYENGLINYSHEGITLKPYLLGRSILIAWNNIDFISPTPAVNHKSGKWETYDGRTLMNNDALIGRLPSLPRGISTSELRFTSRVSALVLFVHLELRAGLSAATPPHPPPALGGVSASIPAASK